MTTKNFLRLLCFAILLYTHLYFSYNYNGGWWHSPLGTLLLLALGRLIWPRHFLVISGLRMQRSELMPAVFLGIAVTGLSLALIKLIAGAKGIGISFSVFTSYLHDVFYILNEEMITGALMLYLLRGRLKLAPLTASSILAGVLCLAHLVLYKVYFRDKGLLEPLTLITLFLAVFVKNNLILRYNHIAYAWAVHIGWMSVMYGSIHVYEAGGMTLTDLEKFNLYLGSPYTFVICLVLCLVNVQSLRRWQRQGQTLC